MQNQAQLIDGRSGNGFSMCHAAEGIAADAVMVYQGIFGYSPFIHCFPTVVIVNHRNPPSNSSTQIDIFILVSMQHIEYILHITAVKY